MPPSRETKSQPQDRSEQSQFPHVAATSVADCGNFENNYLAGLGQFVQMLLCTIPNPPFAGFHFGARLLDVSNAGWQGDWLLPSLQIAGRSA